MSTRAPQKGQSRGGERRTAPRGIYDLTGDGTRLLRSRYRAHALHLPRRRCTLRVLPFRVTYSGKANGMVCLSRITQLSSSQIFFLSFQLL